jgi:hypothetical protein
MGSVGTVPANQGTLSESDCISQARAINPDLVGKAAQVVANAYDQEANAPTSAALDAPVWLYDANGRYVKEETDTTDGDFDGFAVGDVLNMYGGNASFYVDPKTDVCITRERYSVELAIHNVTIETDLAISGYDSDMNALTTGNSTVSDYNITLGADAEDTITIKLKMDAANQAFQLGGVATFAMNDMESLEPSGSEWTEIPVPKWLDVDITYEEDGSANTSGYDKVFVLSNAVLLSEWDSVQYDFTATASSTDPAYNADSNSQDCVGLLFVDSAWDKDSTNKPVFDIYKHDDAETNVGLDETEYSPIGKDTGAVIVVV